MDPTKNYLKLAGQPVQEIEVLSRHGERLSNGTFFGSVLTYQLAPPPEKSLEEEVVEERTKLQAAGKWCPLFIDEVTALCRVLDRREKAKEGK